MRVKNLKPPKEGPHVEPPALTSTPPGVGADGGGQVGCAPSIWQVRADGAGPGP